MASEESISKYQPVMIGKIMKPFEKDQYLYPPEYEGHFESVMLTKEEIRDRIQALAALIHDDFRGSRPVVVCTLKGASPFYIHLLDALMDLRQGFDMEFVRASSYAGTSSTGTVDLVGELKLDRLKNRKVLVVEDIVDTGTTLQKLIPLLQNEGSPSTLDVCTLLDKRLDEGVVKQYQAKYVGFSIPNKFVIGYGLDYNELYRDLKDIFVISQAGIEFDSSTLQ